MSQQSWTIGSDPSCSLVVKHSTVSGQHCRLTRNANGLMLADLDSTNGTYINGQRLRGTQTVSTSDTITLGQTLPMPWPEGFKQKADPVRTQTNDQSIKNESRVITIGRGSENTVVLTGSNVSTQHARIILDQSEIVLEDLGSTNGTSVGKPENKISRVKIEKSDTIFLGSTAYQAADLIEQAESTLATPRIRTEPARSKPSSSGRHVALAFVGIVATLLVLLSWLASRDQTVAENLSPETAASTATPEEPETPVHAVSNLDVDTGLVESPADSSERTLSAQDKISRSLFVIVCSDSKRETPFRVGTGFAIDAQHIVTSAAVVQAMRDLEQNGFPVAYLFAPSTKREVTISSFAIHPQFEIANREARDAQRKHDAIFDQLESQPPQPEAFERVKDQLIEARTKALVAIDQKTTYDVAMIETGESLNDWLPGATDDVEFRPNLKLNIAGYAFDVEDPYFDQDMPIDLSTATGRFVQRVKATEDSQDRMIAKGLMQQHEYAFLGSPVMNSQGKVVGIYSRPTPPSDQSESEIKSSFDVSLFQRVQEF